MGQPAARITDMHVCPMVTPGVPPIPHVGGPVVGPCAPTVLIGKLPGARVTDNCVCVGPPDIIVRGSATVLTAKLPAARIGDNTAHGGVIVMGLPTVLIGDAGSGGGGGASLGGAAGGAIGNVGGVMTDMPSPAEDLSAGGQQAQALRDAAAAGAPFCQPCPGPAAAAAAEAERG